MSLGFWNFAQREPEKLALVTPDEREVTRGELLAESNQLVHGLRALGLQKGDAVAMVLPNGVEPIELYLACFQAGCYLTPINNHLVGPRDRLHRERLRGQGLRRERALRRRR